MNKRLISIIVPVYNEEANIERAYKAIKDEFKNFNDFTYEILFTDNHSSDGTFKILEMLAAKDPQVRVLRFARNFGFQRSILTGYRHAKGDAAIQIDCDLEDPPSVFSEFIRLWKKGHDVVVGIRSQRMESKPMIFLRRLGYKLLNLVSDTPHEVDAGDFRLVDRSIVDQLKIINDTTPYVRGIISELSKNQAKVHYTRNRRTAGKSKFPLIPLIKMGLEGVFAHSLLPLRVASYLGIFIALLTAVILGTYIIGRLFFSHNWPAGFTTLTVLILFGISLNSVFLGIIGEYLGRIYNQTRRRPLVIIEKSLNIDPASSPEVTERSVHGGF